MGVFGGGQSLLFPLLVVEAELAVLWEADELLEELSADHRLKSRCCEGITDESVVYWLEWQGMPAGLVKSNIRALQPGW